MKNRVKRICVVTSTRADYGILKPLIQKLSDDSRFILDIVVTGTHLSPEFGMTVDEIVFDGFHVNKKIDILLSSDSRSSVSKMMGLALLTFSDYFEEHTPDLLTILGDRSEIVAICLAAIVQNIPIAHLCGGDLTKGATDDCFRHSITKMSSLHFPSCKESWRRVIQLGEAPTTVFDFGDLAVENIMHAPLMSLTELSGSIGFPLEDKQYGVVTFHPVTLEDNTATTQLRELMSAMDRFPEMRYIITKANSDAGGREINKIWEEYANARPNCFLTASLGMKRYLSALKYAAAIIGNSSSGILEGPTSKIPTVDIGDRQRGRTRADSVIHCAPVFEDIIGAMQKAFSPEFQAFACTVANPYGDGDTSRRIVEILHERLEQGIDLKKKFFDMDVWSL